MKETESEKIDTSGFDALASMGITPEDVDAADAELVEKRKVAVDRQICACGHAMSRHTTVHGIAYCKPARMECPCKHARAVVVTGDTRLYIRKTDGAGAAHALTRGMRAAAERGVRVEWLVDLVCDRCKRDVSNVVPVPVTQTGHAMTYATGYDALLCPDCRLDI